MNLTGSETNVGKVFKLKVGMGPDMVCTVDNTAGLLGLVWWDEQSNDYKTANIVFAALAEVPAVADGS